MNILFLGIASDVSIRNKFGDSNKNIITINNEEYRVTKREDLEFFPNDKLSKPFLTFEDIKDAEVFVNVNLDSISDINKIIKRSLLLQRNITEFAVLHDLLQNTVFTVQTELKDNSFKITVKIPVENKIFNTVFHYTILKEMTEEQAEQLKNTEFNN